MKAMNGHAAKYYDPATHAWADDAPDRMKVFRRFMEFWGRATVVPVPDLDRLPKWNLEWHYVGGDVARQSCFEWGDIANLVSVAAAGLIERIRRCQCCGRWLFALRDDHQSCSARCRDKLFRSSKLGREKRAAYMRRYRANEKRMNENFIKASKRDTGKGGS